MSAINGDKARFHREKKAKRVRKERSRLLRKQIAALAAAAPAVVPA